MRRDSPYQSCAVRRDGLQLVVAPRVPFVSSPRVEKLFANLRGQRGAVHGGRCRRDTGNRSRGRHDQERAGRDEDAANRSLHRNPPPPGSGGRGMHSLADVAASDEGARRDSALREPSQPSLLDADPPASDVALRLSAGLSPTSSGREPWRERPPSARVSPDCWDRSCRRRNRRSPSSPVEVGVRSISGDPDPQASARPRRPRTSSSTTGDSALSGPSTARRTSPGSGGLTRTSARTPSASSCLHRVRRQEPERRASGEDAALDALDGAEGLRARLRHLGGLEMPAQHLVVVAGRVAHVEVAAPELRRRDALRPASGCAGAAEDHQARRRSSTESSRGPASTSRTSPRSLCPAATLSRMSAHTRVATSMRTRGHFSRSAASRAGRT